MIRKIRRRRGKLGGAGALILLLGVAISQLRDRAEGGAVSASPLAEQVRSASESATPATGGDFIAGKVVKVSDGDTITLLLGRTQTKVRLQGIDAPEKNQPFGKRCREVLAEKAAGRDAKVEVEGRDRYGRTVGKLLVNGQDLNLAQIEAGCAWHYKQYSSRQRAEDRRLYAMREAEARAAKKGLWGDPSPQAPWDFRKSRR